MLKIFTNEQVRRADAYTIENEPVSSINLMDRAAGACTEFIIKLQLPGPVWVVCGPGNNGGDGLAIARMLQTLKTSTRLYIPADSSNYSADFKVNLSRIQEAGIPVYYLEQLVQEEAGVDENEVLVDALFGSGLTRKPEGIYSEVIRWINSSAATVVSVDMPSGLYADRPAEHGSRDIVRASHTLAFQFPKLAFLLPESEAFTGRWHLLPIGIHADFIEKEPAVHYLTEAGDIQALLKPRSVFAHKGNFGHALLIGGSKGKMGAAVLMGRACLRTGAGLATVHVPGCGYEIMQTAVPELMVSTDSSNEYCSTLPKSGGYSAVACGPGLGTDPATASMLKLLIQQSQVPLVLDADALNLLADNRTWLGFLRPGTVLTPHPGEFTRLAGKSDNSFERLEMLRNFCLKYSVYVILKGAYTVVCSPSGNCYFNSTGNPGMATAGSGDVLTGIITGLLAQGYHAIDACLAGVWLHGLAGDLAAEQQGYDSLMAGDIIENLGKAFLRMKSG